MSSPSLYTRQQLGSACVLSYNVPKAASWCLHAGIEKPPSYGTLFFLRATNYTQHLLSDLSLVFK
jgi:hypothetical protein